MALAEAKASLPPEDAHGAGLQRQGCGIGGDVGTGLIDDGDDTHGHGELVDLQSVLPGVPLQQMAHGIGQGSHLPDALGHTGDPVGGQQQPVQHDLGHLATGVVHVHSVGSQNGLLVVDEGLGHGLQGGVFLVRGQSRDREFCRFGGFKHGFHSVTSPNNVPTGLPSRMSYRFSGLLPLAMTRLQPLSRQIFAAWSLVTMPPVPWVEALTPARQ